MLLELSLLTFVATTTVTFALVRARRHIFIVHDGTVGLLSQFGRHRAVLEPGRHVRWGRDYLLRTVDLRASLLQVPGQEVLTADHAQIKLSLMLTVRVSDPVRAVLQTDNHLAHLYAAAQSAVRAAVAQLPLEDLLARRFALGEGLQKEVSAAGEKLGVAVESVELRDVMLPGEIRKAYAEVLQARQAGQAALERARGESAALRSLANAARLIEQQPALGTLRFLQSMEAGGLQPTVVLPGLQALFGQSPPGEGK